MSPRLPASGLGFLLTITFLSGLVLQVPLAAAVGEHVFESNPTVSNADLDVFRDQSVAQSFVATETYRILNATLRLRNMGATTDAIRVSVHGDAGERPAASALDTTQVVSGSAAAFVNAPFPAAPVLSRGARYWIVASHPGLLSDSYRWSHSNANTYASGRAMYDLNLGGGWFNVTPSTDMVFTTYGREDEANVSVDLSVSPVEASWKDTVRFTVRYTNAGTLPARNVWINATLPAGLSYVSDQAAGSTTAYPSFTFADVPNGVHPFTIDARVLVGSSPGATLTASVALEYRNGAGMPGAGSASQASVVVGLATDSLFLVDGTPYGLSPSAPTGGAASQRNVTIRRSSATVDFDLVRAFARPFRGVRAEAFLYLDSRSGSAETVDLNLTLYDVGGTATPVAYAQGRVTTNVATDYEAFAISFPAFDHVFPQGDSLRLRVRNPASSTDDIVLAFGSSLAPSRIDVRTSTHARIDTVERRDAVGPTGAWTSLDAIVVHANVSDPLGPSRILGVRVNATGPDSNPVSADAGMAVLTTDASPLPAWKVFEFRLGPPLMNGTYGFELTADGAAGDYVVVTSVDVRSPAFDLAVGATQSNVAFGERFFYLVYYNNTGASSASRVWLNVSYAPQLLFIGSSDPASESGVSNWSWSSVGPGIHRLDLEVLVDSVVPVPFLRSTFALDVVDGKGHAWPRVSTQADVAMNGPVIAFSQTPSTPAVHSNEPVTFTFALANTGDLAQTLWLNDTLPAGLEYVSNDAATIGGTTTFSGGAIRFVFTNLPTTTWSFQLVVQGSPGIAPGSVLVNRADLNFTNSNGSLMPPQQSDGSVQAFAPQIVGSILVTPGVATPGDAASIAIDVSNTGNEPAPYLWLNLSLDAGLRFLDASRPATVATSTVRFQIADFWVGSDRFFVNVTLDRNASDGQAFLGTAAADYRDAVGNPMATAPLGTATLQASAPRVTVSAVPPIATIEAGASLILTISHANAGSGTAGDVWLNVSLPASFVYVSDTSDGFLTRQIYSLLSWHWSDFAPGSRAFQLELEARSTTADGTAEDFAFRTEYTDRNGNWNAGAGASAHVDFVAPEIQLDLQADRRDV
ncbi:MAG TPA: choice-of-anchor R domain-containing protein, partial [Thermoplasmata archaeon]|nr:choice-of-anchor R domain-containing protein [Thermoplasmata archaeon]